MMILHKDTEQLDLIVISIFDMIELGGNFIQLHWNFFAQLGEEKLLLLVSQKTVLERSCQEYCLNLIKCDFSIITDVILVLI